MVEELPCAPATALPGSGQSLDTHHFAFPNFHFGGFEVPLLEP